MFPNISPVETTAWKKLQTDQQYYERYSDEKPVQLKTGKDLTVIQSYSGIFFLTFQKTW